MSKRLILLISFLTIMATSIARADEVLINDVPVHCIHAAAARYLVPLPLIISILLTENGRVGDARLNKNGTRDYGPMQINTFWLKKISPYGYTREMIQFNPCANVEVGAWILSQSISNGKNIWNGVGNYHSYTLLENAKYASNVKQKYLLLLKYLQ